MSTSRSYEYGLARETSHFGAAASVDFFWQNTSHKYLHQEVCQIHLFICLSVRLHKKQQVDLDGTQLTSDLSIDSY